MSWSKIRKTWRENFLCDSLKDSLDIHMDVYRKSHDQISRTLYLTLGKERIQVFDYYSHQIKTYKDRSYNDWCYDNDPPSCDVVFQGFVESMHLSIEEARNSPNPIVRAFSYVDKRTGKRKLIEFSKNGLQETNSVASCLLNLRLKTEGIK